MSPFKHSGRTPEEEFGVPRVNHGDMNDVLVNGIDMAFHLLSCHV